jgi:tripartite-type tricarboxylate transporter receptor subunit TctC
MAMELFKLRAKVSITHIPFSGTAGAVNAVLSGDVPLMFLPVHVAMAQVKGGRLVVLAAAGDRRSALAPDVPTLAELGYPNVEADLWYGMLAPAGTPRDIVARVNADMTKALALPEVRSALAAQGMEVAPSSPEDMAALMRSDAARWAGVVKQAGIKAE